MKGGYSRLRKKERIVLAVYFTSLTFAVYALVNASEGGNHLKFVRCQVSLHC